MTGEHYDPSTDGYRSYYAAVAAIREFRMSGITKEEASKTPVFPNATWAVVRHGGRASDKWHVLNYWYHDNEHARRFSRSFFEQVKAKLRQGGVALLDPERKVVDWSSGPRLRTRW